MKHFWSLLFFTSASLAQSEVISTDFPDQTESPTLVNPHMFQAEIFFCREKHDSGFSTLAPSMLIRFGVNEHFEVRATTTYAIIDQTGNSVKGFEPVNIGLKAKLMDENGAIPTTSLIAHLQFPGMASAPFLANYHATDICLAMQHTLSDKTSLGYNLGAGWDGFSAHATFLYTLAAGYSLTDTLTCFGEIYGFAPEDQTAWHSVDGGFTLLTGRNLLVALWGGIGLTDDAPDYFAAAGFAFRL